MESGYDELKRISDELTLINYRQEKRVNGVEKKVHHLSIFYFIFQAMILISISQPSSTRCKRWWVPFTLSLLCSILYGITLTHTIYKFVRTRYQLDMNRLEHEMLRRELHMARYERNPVDSPSNPSGVTRELLKPDKVMWVRRYLFICISICVLLGFAAMMLYACHSFPCD